MLDCFRNIWQLTLAFQLVKSNHMAKVWGDFKTSGVLFALLAILFYFLRMTPFKKQFQFFALNHYVEPAGLLLDSQKKSIFSKVTFFFAGLHS